jgi:hypothetical protein
MGVLWLEFYNGIKMNSQTNVQSEVNLHKPRKKVVNGTWNQNGA